MNYNNYFFDLGNTLTLSADFEESFSEVKYPGIDENSFKEVGSVFDKILTSYYSKGVGTQPQWQEVFSKTFKELDIKLTNKQTKELSYLLLDKYNLKSTLAPFAREVLESLKKQNKKIVLVSNVTGPPKVFYKHLKRLEIDYYFQTVIWSSEVGFRKPSNKIFEIALSESGSKVEESVFIGDSEAADITGANLIGMDSILISDKKVETTKANLNMNLEELLQLLDKSN